MRCVCLWQARQGTELSAYACVCEPASVRCLLCLVSGCFESFLLALTDFCLCFYVSVSVCESELNACPQFLFFWRHNVDSFALVGFATLHGSKNLRRRHLTTSFFFCNAALRAPHSYSATPTSLAEDVQHCVCPERKHDKRTLQRRFRRLTVLQRSLGNTIL